MLSLSSLPLLGRGESAAANSCASAGLGDAGIGMEFGGTLRGFGPGFLLAVCQNENSLLKCTLFLLVSNFGLISDLVDEIMYFSAPFIFWVEKN